MRKALRIWRCGMLGGNVVGDDMGFTLHFSLLPGIEPESVRERRKYSPLYFNNILVLELSIIEIVQSIDSNVAPFHRQYTG